MKCERKSQKFCGQVKYIHNRGLSGGENCNKWRAGSIILVQKDLGLQLEIHLDVSGSENAALRVLLTPESVKGITCTEYFLIKAYSPPKTNNTVAIHFKPDNKSELRTLKEICQGLKGGFVHTPTPGIRSEVGLSNSNVVTTPSRKALFSSVGNTSENTRAEMKTENRYVESPQRFTSVKENVRREFDDVDGDFKENIISVKENVGREFDDADGDFKGSSGTPNRATSEKFLQRGIDKSRQSLSALGAKTFYSGSTPNQTNDCWLSSAKRQPGLMPNPTPSKKPRLSNSIPYSMKDRTASEDQKQSQALQGFSNLGNTCYMNAILQSLFGLDTFAADILVTNKRILRTISPQSLYCALAKLLISRKQNLADVHRRELLRKVKGAISASAKRFSGYGQHDAHEFLGQVLDQLKEEVVKISKSTPSPVRERAGENAESEMDYINPTTINFEFEVMHTIRCFQCQEEVSKVEQFHDVSVDLPKRKDLSTPRSLQDSLSIFFRKEDIEYTCEKCGHNKSEVTHKFTRLPRVFIIHLKRYSYDHTYLRNTKMAQSVKIPAYLTLELHCEENTQPAHPVQLQHVNQSKEKALTIFDTQDVKEETPKRKLDFPGFRFNKKGLTPSTAVSGNNTTAPEAGNQEKNKEQARLLKPLTLEDEEDSDFAKAIEMSLKEQEERDQLSRDYGEDCESDFQKVLEMSRHEEKQPEKPSEKDLENLSEEELIQLAIKQSLMETDNFTNNDTIKTANDHSYAESYDIGPDYDGRENRTFKENSEFAHYDKASQLKAKESKFSGINSSSRSRTAENADIIKTCSKAVMSSNDDQVASSGLFSDSDSDVYEIFCDSEESRSMTKLEDRNKLSSENKNNNFTSDKYETTSKYFQKGKNGKTSVLDTSRENVNNDDSASVCGKLPGGKKENKAGFGKKDSDEGSSDTDDFELTVETESEYKRSVSNWCTNSLKSYDKLSHKKTKSEDIETRAKSHVRKSGKENENSKSELRSELKEDIVDLTKSFKSDKEVRAKRSHVRKSGKENENSKPELRSELKEDIVDLKSDKVVSKKNVGADGFDKTDDDSDNKHRTDTVDTRTKCVNKDKTDIGNIKSQIKSENAQVWNEIMEDMDRVVKTPKRKHYGQKLEEIGRNMNENSNAEMDLMKDHSNHSAILQDEVDKKEEGNTVKDSGQRKGIDTEKKENEGNDIYDFQCNEDDSWMLSIDDKENKHPSKLRPVLTDPSDVFGDSNLLLEEKTSTPDELDGFIEDSLDIPEINNEKGDLPYSYQLVSVVSHMGISSSTGHYISDVYDIKKRGWYSFDDSHVSKTTESEVRSKRERSGYIFFYMSKDIYDDLCLHHAVTTTDRKKES